MKTEEQIEEEGGKEENEGECSRARGGGGVYTLGNLQVDGSGLQRMGRVERSRGRRQWVSLWATA